MFFTVKICERSEELVVELSANITGQHRSKFIQNNINTEEYF